MKDSNERLQSLKEAWLQEIQKCYACEKCTSGCPVARFMDYPPSKMVRWLILGDWERLITSNTIWVCSSCQVCVSRCPFEIDIPNLIDAIKEYATETPSLKKELGIYNFHKTFLNNLKKFGRIYEAGLIAELKLKNKNLFEDLFMGIRMFLKGKLNLTPRAIKGKQEIRKLFGKFV